MTSSANRKRGSKLRVRTRVDGPVLKAHASVRIFGPTLDPSEITALLGSSPSVSYRKGDPISARINALRKQGMWLLESRLSRRRSLAEHIRGLLEMLPGRPN